MILYQFERSLRAISMHGLGFLAAASLIAIPAVSVADPGRDLAVASKALDFVEPALGGGTVAVVHDAGSKGAAEALVAAMPAKTKSQSLTASLVDVSDAAAIQAADVVIVAPGTAAGGVASAMAGSGKLCLTTDRAIVEAGQCVMAVSSAPKVEILVNTGAASAFGVGFASAFRMMIKEL